MWFSLVWKIVALLIVVGIEVEIVSVGRDLMNMSYDSAFFLGIALILISLFAAAWLIIHIISLWETKA